MKKKTIEKRRKEIYKAAMHIFSKKGFNKATLDEIAEKVKISKPAIYLYFKNKESLFFSMLEEKMISSTKEINTIINSKTTAIEKLKTILKGHVAFITNNIDFFKIIHQIKLAENINNKSKLHDNFLKQYKKKTQLYEIIIKKCIAEKYLKKTDSLFLAFSLQGMVNQNIFRSITYNDTSHFKDLDKKIFDLFIKGAGI